jgi:hypothetical protein
LAWLLVNVGKSQKYITMKTLINAMIILAVAVLSSCIEDNVGPVGPEGPRGPEGPQGPQGESGFVFEWENVNFTAPDYEQYLSFPDNFESLSSDVALVYLLWDVVEVNGIDTEVWRQIPQTILTEAGILQYNYDFTMGDVRLFMEADFDMSLLGALDTDNWVVRVVVVPGNFWNSSRVASKDMSYEEAVELFGLPELATPKAIMNRRK